VEGVLFHHPSPPRGNRGSSPLYWQMILLGEEGGKENPCERMKRTCIHVHERKEEGKNRTSSRQTGEKEMKAAPASPRARYTIRGKRKEGKGNPLHHRQTNKDSSHLPRCCLDRRRRERKRGERGGGGRFSFFCEKKEGAISPAAEEGGEGEKDLRLRRV